MKAGAIALILSTAALGLAAYNLSTQEAPAPKRTKARDDRVVELEAQVAQLSSEVAALKARAGTGPSIPSSPSATPRFDEEGNPLPAPAAEGDPALAAIVDEAVDRKTKQVMDEMRIKANKKPQLAVFAKVLGLSKEQVAAAERTVVEGQRDVHQILEIPTADGTNLMDQLVELMAKGIAEPGKDHGWGPWIGRVMQEKVPGTDETYGVRIEAVKDRMRQAFEREWSKEQYAEFREWGVDPTEIQEVPESPNILLWERIQERARQLGAQLPD